MHECEWDEHYEKGKVFCWICGSVREIGKLNLLEEDENTK